MTTFLPQGQKRCAGCGEWKPYDIEDLSQSEYTRLWHKRNDGTKIYRPAGRCRKCTREAVARHREKKRREDPEGYREQQRQWHAAYIEKNKTRLLREWRETQTALRREAGIPPRNLRKRIKQTEVMFDAKPLLDWIDKAGVYMDLSASAQRRVREIRSNGRVELSAIDTILTAANRQDMLPTLYPSGAV